jgi:hypothetical protein
MPPKGEYQFAVFLSYASEDAGFASRLHGALERYRIPKSLGQFQFTTNGPANRVYPVFRDRDELPSGELKKELREALESSSALVVVCSPAAAKSEWVNEEIETFLKLGRRERIFGVMAEDAPLHSDDGSDATELSFPPAFRGAPHIAGFTPIVGDARPGKDGFRRAWLKVVAGIAATNLGALQDRDSARRVRRAVGVSSAIFAVVTLLLLLMAAYALQDVAAWSGRSQRAVQLAEEALDEGRPEDALLVALSGLPSGRGHWLVPPNRQAEVVLERAMNELVVIAAADVKPQRGMMDADYEPRSLGEMLSIGSQASSTGLEIVANDGVRFVDAKTQTDVCGIYKGLHIYQAGLLDRSHALVSLSLYRPYFVLVDVSRCSQDAPPFALIGPQPNSRTDDEIEPGADDKPAIAARIVPLQWVDESDPDEAQQTEQLVPLTTFGALPAGTRVPALKAQSKEAAEAVRNAPSISSIIGWADGTVILDFPNERALALFDPRTLKVKAWTTRPQINSEMGGGSQDDHVMERASKIVLNLNAKTGMVVDNGFRFFHLRTVTNLVGATIACGGWCLRAAEWSFDLKRAVGMGVGSQASPTSGTARLRRA